MGNYVLVRVRASICRILHGMKEKSFHERLCYGEGDGDRDAYARAALFLFARFGKPDELISKLHKNREPKSRVTSYCFGESCV